MTLISVFYTTEI